MSGLFDRLGSAFIAPPAPSRDGPRREEAPAPEVHVHESASPPTALGVLCRREDAFAVGGAVALVLAARERSAHAVVAVWGAGEPRAVRAPATRGARRLAAALEARGHAATASGRLAIVRLATDLREAAPEAVRALAAATAAPGAVVLAGARDDSADVLLRQLDGVVVALPEDADPAMADLAVAGLAPRGVDARAMSLPSVPASARALAAAGVALLPPLRAALEIAVGEGAG